MKCLDVNSYDRSKCGAYFEAFRECKKTWCVLLWPLYLSVKR